MTGAQPEPNIGRDLASASTLVHTARESLAKGGEIALADLEARIERTCHALAKLPRPRARAFEAPLIALIDELEKLSQSLTERHRSLKGEMDGLGQRRLAVRAYAKAEGR